MLFDDGYHSVSMLPIVKKGITLTGVIDSKQSNKIVFENFVEQDKLEYIVQENGLKENIIIPCMRDSYTYQFRLQLGNLEADIKGNTIHFLDAKTKDKVFTMGNLFMFDKLGERSKSIQMNIEEVTASDYNLTITPNAKWINSTKRNFPVTIDPQIQIADEPILELKEHVSGMYTPAINHRMVLGVKDGKLHQIALTLNAEDFVSELAKNNIQSFKAYVELHYQQGKRMDESRGFSTYQGSTLIRTDLFKDESKTLILDVSSLIEEELKKYHSGRKVSDVRLNLTYFKTYIGSLSDAQSLDMKISDDYVYLMDRFCEDEKLRPEVQLEYTKEDQVVEGTPFLEYETGKSGKTSLNIYNGNLSHSLGLGSIEADALKIDVGLLYDARLKKQMDSTSKTGPFGKGWMLNVHQRLEKRDDYNKLLGSKDITYYDGDNNPHTLREKWFYEVDDVRHYIPKDLVYIDNDQKMKYKDESSSTIYDVEYEVTSDEGLTLITTNSKMNYVKATDKKLKRKFYIMLHDNTKIEVQMNKKGCLDIPRFILKGSGWKTESKYVSICDFIGRTHVTPSSYLNVKQYIKPENIMLSGSQYKDIHGRDIVKDGVASCSLFYQNGSFYVLGLEYEYYLYPDTSDTFSDYRTALFKIPVIVEKSYFIDKSIPVADYYENEDIAKVNSQIQQIEDYIEDLKLQAVASSNSIKRIEEEINHQKIMHKRNQNLSAVRDAATAKNEDIYPSTIYKSDGEVDDIKTTKNRDYRNLTKAEAELSDDYQEVNYLYQKSSLYSQMEEQRVSLDKAYNKISEYEKQLANLEEQKEAMVAEQKKDVQDYIIDKSGNILGFNYYGKLVYITDSYENEITITYDDNKITEIASKTQRMYFNYDDHNYVTSIVDAQGRRTECFYDQEVLSKLRFIAENNKKQEIKLSYSSNQELCKIVDPSGCYLNAYQDGECGFRIIQGTKTKSISTKEITPLTDETEMVDVLVQGLQTKDYTVVMDNLNQIKTTHSFDVSGRLIHSYEEDLDTKKCTSTFIHFENKNRQFEVSFKEDKKFKSFYLGGEINKKLTAVLNLTTDEKVSNWNTTLNPDAIPTCKLAFARLDLRNLSQSKWLSLNQITLKAVVIDKNGKSRTYTSLFHNLSHQYIGIPFVLNSTDKKVSVSIIGRKSIDLKTIKFMEFFEAEGTINTYNSDDQLIKTEDGTTTTLYEGFVDDKPTRMITIDEFGDRRTSYVSYDSNGRVVYEEDPLRNCKETFYDEKGKVVETREYNKECPTLAKVSKTKYDEHGNATTIDGVMRDEAGNYPQEEIRYLPNSSKVISTKSVSGQVMCYGYDYHTDDLLEIASDTAGQGNSTRMKYRFGLLTSLTHHGFTLDYTLDGQGRKIGMAVAGKTLLTNEYTDQYTDDQVTRGSKVTTKTINGFESTTIKDKEGKLVSTITNNQENISYKYDEDDQLVEVINTSSGELAHTDYNQKGLVVKNKTSVDGISVEEENTYDDRDLVVATKHTFGDKTSTSEFKYDKIHGNRIYETTIDGTLTQTLEYDALNRVTKKTLSTLDKVLIEDEYEYVQYGENSLDLVKEHNVKVGGKLLDTVSYTYDVAGNITNVLRDEFKTRYTYDKLNRLVREDNPRLNQTIVYKYDNGGNILLKKTYPYTLEQEVFGGELCHYTYSSENWKDQLVDFNGQAITYDETGRPTQIGNTALSWNLKGQLTSFGDTQYTYNLSGIRTSKTVKGIKTDYYLSGNKILREMSNEKDIIYHYAMEKLVGFLYNNVEYIYERNVQGDILGIYKKDDLTKVAEYVYDAYGNHKVINYAVNNIGDINPIRYRGYYYDQETKLYYLNSRYYSPEIGRFISPDTLSILDETKAQINGLNLYMYCNDNPVMGYDPAGQWNWGTFWKGLGTVLIVAGCVALAAVTCGAGAAVMVGVSTAVSVAAQGIQDAINGEFSGLDAYFGAAIGGAISGLGQGLGTTALTSGLGSLASGLMEGSITSFNDACINFALGGVSGAIGYGISVGISRVACATKLSKIIGPSSKNKVINKNLEKAGYATIKMGKEGLGSVARKFYKEAGFKTMERILGQIYAFGTSFIL